MNQLNGEHYVEVKDHRYKIHPTENIILRKRDRPISLRTQYQVQNETKIWRNQRVTKNDNDELLDKNYPKNKNNQPIIPQQQLPNCPSCKRNNWLEFDKGYYCRNCEYIINKQKHQINKIVLRQKRGFSTRIIYANTKIRDIYRNMVNTNCNSTEDKTNKLQRLKGKTKLKKNISEYYIEMKNRNFQTQEDPYSRNAKGISRSYHEVSLSMKFLQTKPQVKNMNIKYYDLYYTVIRIRGKNRDIGIQYEIDGNDYINYNDIIPNQYVGIRGREVWDLIWIISGNSYYINKDDNE